MCHITRAIEGETNPFLLRKLQKSQAHWKYNTNRPNPATQWTAMQHPGSSRNLVFSRFNQSSTIWVGGGAPSSKGQSCSHEKNKHKQQFRFCWNNLNVLCTSQSTGGNICKVKQLKNLRCFTLGLAEFACGARHCGRAKRSHELFLGRRPQRSGLHPAKPHN